MMYDVSPKIANNDLFFSSLNRLHQSRENTRKLILILWERFVLKNYVCFLIFQLFFHWIANVDLYLGLLLNFLFRLQIIFKESLSLYEPVLIEKVESLQNRLIYKTPIEISKFKLTTLEINLSKSYPKMYVKHQNASETSEKNYPIGLILVSMFLRVTSVYTDILYK